MGCHLYAEGLAASEGEAAVPFKADFLGPSLGGFLLGLSPVWLPVSDVLDGLSSSTFWDFGVDLVELIGGRPAGLGVAAGSAGCSFGGSFGAVRTFHSGLALGACLPRDAETLIKSWSKKMSNEMLGIGSIVYQELDLRISVQVLGELVT